MRLIYDVLIVGGGMVGASLAVALKDLPLRMGLVDAYCFGQASQPSYDDRSVALAYGSRLIYQGMGLWPALKAAAEPILNIHVSDRGHFGATRLSASQQQVPALGYVVESRALGTVLHQALHDSKVDLIAPATVYAVHNANADPASEPSETISISIEQQGLSETLQARLLVVADGSQSPLRELLDIPVTMRDYAQTAVIANVSTENPHQNLAYERFTPDGPLALLPMQAERYSLVWTQPQATVADLLNTSDADFLQQLQQAFGWRQGRFLRVGKRSSFPLKLIKAQQEVKGRAVLIGNASHTLHPVAGQGLNLALRDVALLSELIAKQALRGEDLAAPAVLAQYQVARQADYRQVSIYTDSLVRVFSNANSVLGHARAAGLLAVDRVPALRSLLAQRSMGLAFRQPRLARGKPLLS